MRTGTGYSKTFSKMMWLFALLLVVLATGCDRDHGGAGGDPGPAGPAPNLGLASTYGIIAFDAINTGTIASHIYGDVALTGGVIASVTGAGANNVPAAPLLASTSVTTSDGVTPGIIIASDNGTAEKIATLPQLQLDLNAAYQDLINRPAPATVLTDAASAEGVNGGTFGAATDLSGFVLSPGVYASIATYGLSNAAGPLVLDAGGNPGAVFIIRSTAGGSGFTSTTGDVVLRNGARSTNVFWVVTNNITIGTGTFFQGTVVAGSTITVVDFANVEGRMLAGALGAGALTLTGTSIIVVPAP
ncbi:MAG: hypothetical protein A2X56_01275 [Nitrospirae bacterium GWC2_57_13]|jgi:hypothetical protein|nr:MAG: hypothetical protein A2X56_01275 [Nitrospirae bacterium GWC2_57_13]HAR46048.1 hypothetical protein [Nitrospiraceae bacterium]HAS52651.1 hypothetical protein [Nitrospiraceae bacterium]